MNKTLVRLSVFAAAALFSSFAQPLAAPRGAAPKARPAGPARGRATSGAQREGRLAPPAVLRCPRDNTTSFTGRVTAYRRYRNRIFLRVRTDEQTTEEFTVGLGQAAGGGVGAFLLRGETFGRGDWVKIEGRRGRLRAGMRATVWACYHGDKLSAEVVDWRPAGT